MSIKLCKKCEKNESYSTHSWCKECLEEYHAQRKLNSIEQIIHEDLTAGEVVDKRERRLYDWNDVNAYYVSVDKRKERQRKQSEANYHVQDSSKFLGVVLLGDYHLGSQYLDKTRLKNEMSIMDQNKHQLIAVQVGDILNNEAVSSHRGQNRVQPMEMPLDEQREFAKMVFNEQKDYLAAFILGNHDYRLLITSTYDFGEQLATKIQGVYLGFSGDLFIRFPEVVYKMHLTHEGKGYSTKNAAHSGMRVADDDHSYDLVVFGHRHDGVACLDQPMGGDYYGRAMAVRTGGFKDGSLYAEYRGFTSYEMNTPMVILHPTRKYITFCRDLVEGMRILNALNRGEE